MSFQPAVHEEKFSAHSVSQAQLESPETLEELFGFEEALPEAEKPYSAFVLASGNLVATP